MKKIFLLAICMFLFSFFIDLESDAVSLKKSALANGSCCQESSSMCVIRYNGQTTTYVSHYYKNGAGRCGDDDEDEDEE